eukprot:TRINITY_DN667_c0_g1_i1.p1 TRINITY_DN667_c0_g1~~TRINITY_DN667_c0_g1_i1.p1  ORF type:complete len:131 (+),score=7.97 TRINITY_DN667_c0_g1_i1:349-741(+)
MFVKPCSYYHNQGSTHQHKSNIKLLFDLLVVNESKGCRGQSVLDCDEDAPRVVAVERVVVVVDGGVHRDVDGVGGDVRDVHGVHDGGVHERGDDCGGCVNRPPSIAKHPMLKVLPFRKAKCGNLVVYLFR